MGRRLLFAGGLASAAAALAYWWRWARRQDWLETVLAQGCRHVPPLPHVGLMTLLGIVMCLIAVACFGVCLLRSERVLSAAAGVLLIAAMLGAVGGTVVLVDTPSKASDGLDGSGLPCPAG